MNRDVEEILALLKAVDDPTPSIPVTAIVRRAEVAEAGDRARRVVWMKRAAAIVLAVGIAGVSYALPGSPVRAWIRAIVERIGSAPPRSLPGATEEPPSSASGIAVPVGARLTIEFVHASRDARVFVSWAAGADLEVQAPAGAAAFTTSADRLQIDNRDTPGAYAVRIPRAAPWVEIVVAGERIFLKDGDRVVTAGVGTRAGIYVLPLAPTGPRAPTGP